MKKAGILILMVLFACALVFSQVWTGQGRQIGFVYDEEGNPLEGVKVKLFFVKRQSGFELTTDANGKWVAIGVKGGTWHIDFEKKGYMTKKITWNILDFRQVNPPVKVKLKKVEGLVVSDKLKEDYKKAVEIKEDFLDGIYQLGLVYLNLGKNAEALNEFENYLKNDPDSEKASQVRGFIEYLKRK